MKTLILILLAGLLFSCDTTTINTDKEGRYYITISALDVYNTKERMRIICDNPHGSIYLYLPTGIKPQAGDRVYLEFERP